MEKMMTKKTLMFVVGAVLATCTTVGAYAQGGVNCAAAIVATDGVNAYNNAAGTVDMDYTGFCDMGAFGTDFNYHTVWFKWTASTTDTYTVSTCGTAGGVDTRLSAQTDCTAASVIACNDDGIGCATFSSLMTFSATAGTQYFLAVGVYSATTAGGAGTMSITAGSGGGGGGGGGGDCCVANPGTTCCADQTCCDTVCAADAYCCTTEWDATCAGEAATLCPACGGGGGGGDCCVANPGTTCCADQTCCDTVCASDAYCCTTDWDATCADEAATLCPACGAGGCKIPPAATQEQEACGDDTNGGCNGGGASEPLSSLNTSIGGTFYASTATRDTDWYSFTVTTGTEITLSLYSNLPSFCAIVDNPGCSIIGAASAGTCPSTTTICIGPGDYYVVALPSQFIELPCGGGLGSEYTLQISSTTCDFTPPAGDNCDAPMIAQLGANPFTNVNAGTSWTVVNCAPFTKDVFFSFVAPATDGFTFQTCDSSAPFDTGIEVWDGCPDAGGNLLACNDDGPGCPNFSSLASADLTSGQTYIIRVGGWNGATGSTELNISQGAPVGPENDDCANATVAIVGANPFDTNGSTTDGPNPTDATCGAFGASFYNDVWFSFTAPTTENYLVSICTAGWDTRLDIYTSCGGTIVVCNDDADSGACGLSSEVTLAATAGTSYRIRIGGYGAANFGTGSLDISASGGGGGGGGGAGLTCAEAVTLAMGDTVFTRAGATVDLDYTGICDMGPFGTDVNNNVIFYKFSPTQSGLYTFSTCNSATHDTRLSAQTSCDTTTVIACNDDGAGCTGFTSILDVQLSCGIEYIIAIGGYSATTALGTGTLHVTVASPVSCGTPCLADYNHDGLRNGADLAYLLFYWGTPDGDVTGDGLTNASDLTLLLSGWGTCPQ